jgi:hypothetical protein
VLYDEIIKGGGSPLIVGIGAKTAGLVRDFPRSCAASIELDPGSISTFDLGQIIAEKRQIGMSPFILKYDAAGAEICARLPT